MARWRKRLKMFLSPTVMAFFFSISSSSALSHCRAQSCLVSFLLYFLLISFSLSHGVAVLLVHCVFCCWSTS